MYNTENNLTADDIIAAAEAAKKEWIDAFKALRELTAADSIAGYRAQLRCRKATTSMYAAQRRVRALGWAAFR